MEEALTPDPSPRTGEGSKPSPPTPLPGRERGAALTPNPSPRTGEGSSPHPRPLSQGGRGEIDSRI